MHLIVLEAVVIFTFQNIQLSVGISVENLFLIRPQCQIGDVIIVKAGGECIWDPKDVKQKRNTLLIAGGIGINPIYSILQHIEETRRSRESNDDYLGRATLLYSASTRDELIFKVSLLSVSSLSFVNFKDLG